MKAVPQGPLAVISTTSVLGSHGIEVFVYRESLSGMYGFYSQAIGRISLGVHGDEMEKAAEIIGEYRREEGGDSAEGDDG